MSTVSNVVIENRLKKNVKHAIIEVNFHNGGFRCIDIDAHVTTRHQVNDILFHSGEDMIGTDIPITFQ